MKFPTATVTLVSAALIFIVWDQARDRPDPSDPSRFTNLTASPVERSEVVDWVVTQIPALCEKATDRSRGNEAFSECVERSEARNPACRRAIYDKFPSVVATDAVFREVSLTMMSCLVPQSKPLD